MTPRYAPPVDTHPDKLWSLVEHLGRRKAPLPWDNRIQRLVNGVKEPHLYLGRSLDDLRPWLLHKPLLYGHAHYLGGNDSSGIALGLIPIVIQLLAASDASVVVLDMGGDRNLWWTTFIEAKRAGLLFRWVSTEPETTSFSWNPLFQRHNQQRRILARAESLLKSLGLYYGDGYRKLYWAAISLDTIMAFLGKFHDIKSFAQFARYAEDRSSYVATKTNQQDSQLLLMLLRQLAKADAINVTEESDVAPGVRQYAIDMSNVLTQKQVLYFWLPSFEEELTGISISKLALYALIEAARVLKRSGQPSRCFIVLQNFHQVCGENVKTAMQTAKALGVHIIACHQDASQLRTCDYDTIESCTNAKYILDASSLNALKMMEEHSGQTRERTVAWSQFLPAGFDENDESRMRPNLASSIDAFSPPIGQFGDRTVPRFNRNQILAISAHPLRGFVRSRTDSGLTQYGGQWTAIESEFPTTYAEFKERDATPLPREHPNCLSIRAGDLNDEPDHDEGLPNDPLPVTPPDKSVDEALATRLKAFQERVRNQHKRPK